MPLLDAKEAAELVKLAPATLAKLRVVGGGPPYIKIGARVVYEVADLEAWVAARGKRRSTSDTPRAA
ncbi:hypothetical protein J421_4325 [Gemmatirosa kalamazoonensis]|uniref:Helix-turn-helix domain-containing protein n=1 Tax=Gemmatirosa kalamazoonensis TaxID=861299 RepID=W0RMZ9_9BACT|nr:helix-turn-helix domain-containing protein [Gemmatirosa kalamazoonensis]AHG91862.1 hypothetical protein J421_4325 [Gemmatirosa kalamazoonensis]